MANENIFGDAQAVSTAFAAALNSTGSGNLPWASAANPGNQNSPNNGPNTVSSAFFQYLIPDYTLWDKLAEYRLVVIDTAKGNKVVGGGSNTSDVQVLSLGNSTFSFSEISLAWEFFFPISPQQLSISDQYAIRTSATLKGVLEQHSGTRFKGISIQGTFGIWPGRTSIVNPPGTPNALQSVFGGTIASATNVATQFSSIVNNITNGSNATKPKTVRPGDAEDPEEGLGTGYYKTLMLTQLLEQYTEAKKDPANASWRLVFDIPKQNQSFVVTPVAFNWTENVNKPMQIDYNIQFKAWRRINLNDNVIPIPSTVTPLSPGILQQILNTISAAQNTAAAAANLIGSVRSDVDNILNIIRQTGLLVKGIAGAAVALSDLPAELATDASSTWTSFVATLNPNNLAGSAKTDSATLTTIGHIKTQNKNNEGLPQANVASGQNGPSAAAQQALNPSNATIANPLRSPMLLSQIPVSSLSLNTAQQNAVNAEIKSVGSFTVADIKARRATIATLCTQLANSFNAGDAYYNSLFNLPNATTSNQPMNLDQFDILQTFYQYLQSLDILTATNQLDTQQNLNNMQYVAALAATSDIEFNTSVSKIQVPVPFGLTMEQIAMRYLGDPQRWLEIATLNELREPYIDNDGFQYALLSNADGRNIVVNSNQDLHIGQIIFLHSNTQAPTARTIINITQLSLASFLITLDGLANLGNFTIVDQAYLQAYLPGTVNSQNVIFVPSDSPTPADDMINIPQSVANVNLVGLSKVDWLLTPQGDIAVDVNASFQLAAGIPNLIQALAIKFGTGLGTSLLNPTFGLGTKPSTMNSDFSAAKTFGQIQQLVTADPRFSGVSGIQLALNGPSLGISLGVGLSGVKGLFPVSFQLPTTQ